MAFDYALFITHPDREYLVFLPEFADPDAGLSGYSSQYEEATTALKSELVTRTESGATAGDTIIHEDPVTNHLTIERHWASQEAAQEWVNTVVRVHTAHNAPIPLQFRLVNELTSEETILSPTA